MTRLEARGRAGGSAVSQTLRRLEPRAPELEIPRPMGAGVGARLPYLWGVSELARLASLALHGDKEALKTLLEKVADIAENARERTASALLTLHELDLLLAEGCEKLPEAKAHIRVASARLHAASEALLETAAVGAALARALVANRPLRHVETEGGSARCTCSACGRRQKTP